jgi:hypothetical protein
LSFLSAHRFAFKASAALFLSCGHAHLSGAMTAHGEATPVDLDSLPDEVIEQMSNLLTDSDERKLH